MENDTTIDLQDFTIVGKPDGGKLMTTLDTRGSEASRCLEHAWAALQTIIPWLPPVVCVILPAVHPGGLANLLLTVDVTSPHTKPMN